MRKTQTFRVVAKVGTPELIDLLALADQDISDIVTTPGHIVRVTVANDNHDYTMILPRDSGRLIIECELSGVSDG